MQQWHWAIRVAVGAMLATAVQAKTGDEVLRQCTDSRGNPDLRIARCTALIQSGKEPTENLANTFYNRGAAYLAKHDYDHAIQDFDQSIKNHPNSAVAFADRGLAYTAKADYDHGLETELFGGYALGYRANGEYDRAIQDFSQAIQLDPNFAVAFANRGLTYHRRGADDRAIQDFGQALQLKPNFASALFNRGIAYHTIGEYDHAIQDFDQVIKLDLNNWTAFARRCWVRATWGQQLPTALADCNESLRLRQNTKALSYRALVFFRMGEWDGAIRDCDAILRIDPRAADSLFERGISKLRKGDTAGGDADIVASKARDPMVEKVFAGYGITP